MVPTHRPASGSFGPSRDGISRDRASQDRTDRSGTWPATWSRTGRRVPRHDRWQRLFRGQETELRQLRRWLAGLLPDSCARDDLISVAVELGTNAVQHTASGDGGWFTVEVACLGPVIRVAVTDEGAPGSLFLSGDPLTDPAGASGDLGASGDGDSDRGRGLLIVRALSVASGVCGNPSGRTVWAEVAAPPQGRSSSPSASSAMASSRTL
jgi:anti-sigma regulatory factor (Ser/Thr protein kinase)